MRTGENAKADIGHCDTLLSGSKMAHIYCLFLEPNVPSSDPLVYISGGFCLFCSHRKILPLLPAPLGTAAMNAAFPAFHILILHSHYLFFTKIIFFRTVPRALHLYFFNPSVCWPFGPNSVPVCFEGT